jgi:subtilase family serine protease
MRCHAILRTDLRRASVPSCSGRPPYCPSDLRSAYRLPSSGGTSITVAIVDAFGYKNVAADLATYRSGMGLKPCPAGSCFRVVNQNGNTHPLPPGSPPDNDWYGEQALDIDMVSATCPSCHILLIETQDNSGSNLFQGVQTAAAMHADIVSTSFGGSEFTKSDPRFAVPGMLFVASSGDFGAGVQQPCAFATVVCVGGTQLKKASNSRGWSETVWNTLRLQTQCGGDCGATGSGCSSFVPVPSWQGSLGCPSGRAETDLSADASVTTPLWVYSAHEGGWVGFGGTSAAAPMIAGIFGLAGHPSKVGGPKYVWQHRNAFFGVTKGNNIDGALGVPCPAGYPKYICTARAGYDGPTGWGTPNGLGAF